MGNRSISAQVADSNYRKGVAQGVRAGRIQEKRKNSASAGIATVVVIILAILGGLGIGQFRYQQGVNQGKEIAREEIISRVQELGAVVEEKSKFSSLADDSFKGAETLTEAEIGNFLSQIEWMRENTKVEKLKEEFRVLAESVKEFQEFYTSSESDAVSTLAEYNKFKTTLNESANKIESVYQEKISELVKAL